MNKENTTAATGEGNAPRSNASRNVHIDSATAAIKAGISRKEFMGCEEGDYRWELYDAYNIAKHALLECSTMSSRTQHSPLPWSSVTTGTGLGAALVMSKHEAIASVNTVQDSKLIVASVNNADKLAEVLQEFLQESSLDASGLHKFSPQVLKANAVIDEYQRWKTL